MPVPVPQVLFPSAKKQTNKQTKKQQQQQKKGISFPILPLQDPLGRITKLVRT